MPQGVGRQGGSYVEPQNRLLEFMPFVIGGLIAAHLLAFAYWIYRVIVEKQPRRRKTS